MKLQFYLKPKYAIVGLVLLIGFGFYQANKPVEYTFSSVYDVETNHHNVHLKSNSNSDRYNERCADDLAENLEKANILNYDIRVVNDGEYDLYYFHGEKIK